MPRNVGKITREAPLGPEMNEQEFVDAMNDLGDDAARWRHFRRNYNLYIDSLPLERLTGFELQQVIDRERGA
jgi:hypothetical protein